MASRSTAKYLRVPPRKARLVADLIKGKQAKEATVILKYTPNKSAKMIDSILKSAISNVTFDGKVDEKNLFVREVVVNPGPTIKRYNPRAQGRADRMNRRTSHITVVLDER
ncbi:MAG: 50S ribosomal protein L22 [Bdellovibrionales bacterium]|nr:50S ribosomal protein L22 [Bdellovibrionales bacterium]